MKNLRIAPLLLAALFLIPTMGPAVELRTSASSQDTVLTWLSPAEGEALAKKTGKPILYNFTAEWCGYCRVLDRAVFSNVKHSKRIATSFVTIKVMDRRRETGSNTADVDALQRKYQVRGFPTLVVKKKNGKFDVIPGFAGEDGTVQFLKKNGMK